MKFCKPPGTVLKLRRTAKATIIRPSIMTSMIVMEFVMTNRITSPSPINGPNTQSWHSGSAGGLISGCKRASHFCHW